ncbi:unnamed protein product [Trifolium pratense]|uniref:Uncharacterized protein n=1 Tax=Trifolium pratense TaxID=57577 RepID=A0ACB0KH87_TRIPR|nr:unnamed protein product [Trifolium pratense]
MLWCNACSFGLKVLFGFCAGGFSAAHWFGFCGWVSRWWVLDSWCWSRLLWRFITLSGFCLFRRCLGVMFAVVGVFYSDMMSVAGLLQFKNIFLSVKTLSLLSFPSLRLQPRKIANVDILLIP